MQVRLEVAHEKANIRTVVVTSDVLIGRSAECNLRIAASQVSRRHCRLTLNGTGVFVRDLHSSNGTFVDGEPVAPDTDVPLAPGSKLSIGGVEFLVRFDPPRAANGGPRLQSGTCPAEAATDRPTRDEDADSSRRQSTLKSLFGLFGRYRNGDAETTELPAYEQGRSGGEPAHPSEHPADEELGEFLNQLGAEERP